MHTMDTEDGRAAVRIRPVRAGDELALHRLLAANREHLAATSPARPDSYYTLEGQEAAVTGQVAAREAGTAAPYVIVLGGRIVGRVSLSNIVRGAFQSADLGYWIDREHQGRGIVSNAVGLLVGVARDDLGLHRVAAGTLTGNVGSQRVLVRNGFEQYGLARRYLRIAGEWRDHALFQRILDD